MSALMLMDSDIRSHFGIPPITDTVAPTDHHLSLETLDAEPGILYVAREDIRTLPLAKPLQIMPGNDRCTR